MKDKQINVLHICDFAAPYPGSFICSLESLETYHDNVKNFYLFPVRARKNQAKEWISELNVKEEVAYIQEENIFRNISLFLNIIKKHKITRVVRHFSDMRMDAILWLFYNNKKVIRFFRSDHNKSHNIIKQTLREMMWKNNVFVGISDAMSAKVKSLYPKATVHTIINAIYFDRLDHVDDFQRKDAISLFMMGRDTDVKGVDLALKAVHALRPKYNVILQMAAGRNEENVKKLAKELLGQEVDWLYFLPPTNNIGTYYKGSDIFLSPSRKEAFGNANIEAVYCKNSVVLSKVDGQGELKIDGAYWIEPNNVEDFTEKLEQAIIELNTPEKIAQREHAKQQVEQTYSLKNWSDNLVDIL